MEDQFGGNAFGCAYRIQILRIYREKKDKKKNKKKKNLDIKKLCPSR